jgi:hypothetical protein
MEEISVKWRNIIVFVDPTSYFIKTAVLPLGAMVSPLKWVNIEKKTFWTWASGDQSTARTFSSSRTARG